MVRDNVRNKQVAAEKLARYKASVADYVWRVPAGVSQQEICERFGSPCHQFMLKVFKSLLDDGAIIRTSGPDKRHKYYMQGN